MVANAGGGSSGIARGQIVIDTSQFERAGQIVVSVSRQMSQAGTQASQGLRAVQTTSRQTASALQDVGTAGQQAGQQLQSVFSGALLAGGIRFSNQLRSTNTLFEILSGSQEKAVANMEALRRVSEETGQPMIVLKEAAVALLPAISASNAELDKTLNVAQKLAILTPSQGSAGAAFALRQYFSGDYISLTDRFDLNRTRLLNIRNEAGGDAQKLIEGLSEYIDEMGLTTEKVREMNEAGVTAFENAGAAAREAAANAFTPALNILTMMLQAFTNLNNEAPEVTQALASIAGGIAAITVANAALERTQALLAGIRASSTGRAIGVGLAATAGVGLGVAASRALADRGIGDSRLRSDSGEDPGKVLLERVGQILVVFTEAVRRAGETIINIASIIRTGGQFIANVFEVVGNGFRVAGETLSEVISNIGLTIGRILEGLADNFSGVFDTTQLRLSGQDLQQTALANIAGAQANRAQAIGVLQRGPAVTPEQMEAIAADNARIMADWNNTAQGAQRAIVDFLFPAIQEQAEATQQASTPLQQFASAMHNSVGSIREVNNEIRALTTEFEREKQRIAEERSIAAGRQAFDTALGDARSNRDWQRNQARQEEDWLRNRAANIRQFNQQAQSTEAEAMAKRLDMLADFRQEDARRAEDHGRKLAEIERSTNDAVEEAAAGLDARAVFFAQRNGRRQLDEETSRFNLENQRRNEDFNQQLQDLQTNLQAQQEQRRQAFEQQMADDLAAFQLQRQRQAEDRAIQAQDEAFDRALRQQRQLEDYAREDALRQETFADKIAKMRAQFAQESGLQQQFVNSVAQTAANVRNVARGMFSGIAADAQAAAQARAMAAQTSVFQRNGTTIPMYDGGGFPPLNRRVSINERGLESGLSGGNLALFTQPTQIFTAQQTRNMLGRGGSGGGGVNIGSISVSVGDIGNRSDGDVMALVEQGIRKVFIEMGPGQ